MTFKRWHVAAALLLGLGGVGIAWYLALTSEEVAIARDYVLQSEEVKANFGSVSSPVLTGFRIGDARARFTFWAQTTRGRKMITVAVNKTTTPWTTTYVPDN
jgi:hypothetical protein